MNERLDYLDSTRGIAAFTVLLSHFFGAYASSKNMANWDHTVLHGLWHGEGAVSYFFVLSGFVLSYTYFVNEKKFKKINYAEFVLKRILRIYPVFIAVLILSWIAVNYFFSFEDLQGLDQANIWVKQFWDHRVTVFSLAKEALLFVRIPTESQSRLINQDWTLTVELIVSLLVPGMIIIAKRNSWWLILVIVILLRLHTAHWIVEFAIGVLIAANLPLFRKLYTKLNKILKLLVAIIIMLTYTAEFLINMPEIVSVFLLKISVGLLLILVLCSNSIQKLVSIKSLVFLGEMSYCLYLCHFIIILVLSPQIFILLSHYQISDGFISKTFVLLVTVICSLLLSYFLRTLVEKPAINASRKFLNFLDKSKVLTS